jgi:hypothetical protein
MIVGYGFTEPAPAGGRPPWSHWEGIRRYHLKSLDRVLDQRSAQWELPGNICFVDSGGPVFFGPVSESGTKRRTIVATVAAGGGDCNSLSYHMRVDNEEVQSWIEGQIQQFLKTHP